MAMDWTAILTTVGIAVAAAMFTIFAKAVYGIFVAGVRFNQQFVTQDDFEERLEGLEKFKKELKADMQNWMSQLERMVSASSNAIIKRELERVTLIEKKMQEFNNSYIELKTNLEWMKKQSAEITTLTDEMISIKKRLAKLEIDDGQATRRIVK